MSEFMTVREALQLEYPQSVGVFETYAQAQEAVDYLSDQKFEVEHLQIIGTDLKSIERVTGRRTWLTVIGEGFISGLGLGLFVGGMLYLFSGGHANFWALMGLGTLMGGLFMTFTAMLAYGLTGGRRDFESERRVVASRYEVQAEHKVAQQARDMLANRGAVVSEKPEPSEKDRTAETAGTTKTAQPAEQAQATTPAQSTEPVKPENNEQFRPTGPGQSTQPPTAL